MPSGATLDTAFWTTQGPGGWGCWAALVIFFPGMYRWPLSLSSKRFQSSYCTKVRAGAKKKKFPPPPPSFLFFLLSSLQLIRRTREETLTTQATGLSETRPIIVYCVANYRPHISQFWANVMNLLSHFLFVHLQAY